MDYVIIYLTLMNALAFGIMYSDKQKARNKRWRIPERTLLLVAALGGSLGSLLGMQLFRHKTKHLQFSLGIPVMLAVHIALLALLFYSNIL